MLHCMVTVSIRRTAHSDSRPFDWALPWLALLWLALRRHLLVFPTSADLGFVRLIQQMASTSRRSVVNAAADNHMTFLLVVDRFFLFSLVNLLGCWFFVKFYFE